MIINFISAQKNKIKHHKRPNQLATKRQIDDYYGVVSYYHDRYDLEADAVLHLEDGRYALIEIKLGGAEIEKGAKHLLEIRDLIRKKNKTEKQLVMNEPSVLMVITGGPIAYTRPDGVHVVPLASLKN